jgi:hypothetical protein
MILLELGLLAGLLSGLAGDSAGSSVNVTPNSGLETVVLGCAACGFAVGSVLAGFGSLEFGFPSGLTWLASSIAVPGTLESGEVTASGSNPNCTLNAACGASSTMPSLTFGTLNGTTSTHSVLIN